MGKESMQRIYRFSPTGKGLKFHSQNPKDRERQFCCTLFPDCDRNNIYSKEELAKMEWFPFRPVAYAMLTPCYNLELHGVSGYAGYGRIAVIKGKQAFWLDTFEDVEAEYVNGGIHYQVRTPELPGITIRVHLLPTTGAAGIVGCVDCRELDEDIRIYFLHGGVMGWNTHGKFVIPYQAEACLDNIASLEGKDSAWICLDGGTSEYSYPDMEPIAYHGDWTAGGSAWKYIEGWQRKVLVRTDECRICLADPTAMLDFAEEKISSYSSVRNGLVCARLTSGKENYIGVGRGKSLENQPLEELYEASYRKNLQIAERMTVSSDSPELDSAVKIAANSTQGIFGDNVFLHGAASWKDGYLGWRTVYGPLAYGMLEEAATHFESHFQKALITEGLDQGSFSSRLEGKPRLWYNMVETFVDQMKCYLNYTGDRQFAERIFPLVEGCINREIRRLKPGREWLFENSLNTWISDSHWILQGQCTQASAYMYNMFRFASDLADTHDKKLYYAKLAEKVKNDAQQILWQKRKGIFAYGRDLRGNQLLHGEPELPDVYHSAEFGLANNYQTYQMLDWVEANLRAEVTDNGAKVYWSANWHPNSGDTYSHSTYELVLQEELNLALIYYQLGLVEEGYELFKASYMCLYGGRDDGIIDHDLDKYVASGYPMFLVDTVGDLACHITTNGTPRRNPQFSDTISMFGRTLYEGLLGIRPCLLQNKLLIMPSLPAELPFVEVKSHLVDYRYERKEDSHTLLSLGCQILSESQMILTYHIKRESCILQTEFILPVAKVCAVEADGKLIPYQVEPLFGGIKVKAELQEAREGTVLVRYQPFSVKPIEARRILTEGETLTLKYEREEILEVTDPQGILSFLRIDGDSFICTITGGEGSGVFFLKMRAGETEYLRPVKLEIRSAQEREENLFRNPAEEFVAPLRWETIPMDEMFNAASPIEVMDQVRDTVYPIPAEYSQINIGYYKEHISTMLHGYSLFSISDERWRSLVGEDGIAMTGEGIPFRSRREGAYMAAATLAGSAYEDRVTVPINVSGRGIYLLVTGITFPMQSHVENARVTITYEDGITQIHPLVNPFDIGDMWSTIWGRYHDTPGAGFENMGGNYGAMSSAGLDLCKPILTDTEAHILRFRLRECVKVKKVEFRIIAQDVIFALMGVTVLE